MTEQDSFEWVPRLHQLFDTALPNGGYAHSQGLEGLVQTGEIVDEETLTAFVRAEFADSLIHVELPLFRLAHSAVRERRFEELRTLDQLSRALRPTRELRASASAIGRQTYLLFERITRSCDREHQHLVRACEFLEHFQAPVVLAVLAALIRIPLAPALSAYAQMLLAGFVAPGIKLLRFGPGQVQTILFSFGGDIPQWVECSLTVPIEDLGTTAPRWDIASAHHEHADRRLFIS